MIKILHINDLDFKLTCLACPEQYDVFDADGIQVGYIRLRHGYLSVTVPDCGYTVVYTHMFRNKQGQFKNERQRLKYLRKASKIIKKSV